MKNYYTEISTLESKISSLQSSFDEISKKGQVTQSSIKNIKLSLKENTAKITHLSKQKQSLSSEISKLQSKLQSKQLKVDDLTAELSRVKDMQHQQKSHSAVVSALLQGQQKQLLSGIYGRLGDLGSIDAKYQLACSVAAPALDFIVVDTVANAESSLDYLRQNNAGRTTFIGKSDAHPNALRLVDLVTCSDDLRLAFFFALKNTLVCEDLEVARSVAFGSKPYRRVVTLSGDLIETSGAMCGGGQKKRIRIGSSQSEGVSAEEVAVMEEDLYKITRELEDLSADFDAKTLEFDQIERTLAATVSENKELEPELTSLQSYVVDLEKMYKAKKSENGEIKTLEKKLPESDS
ncbi:hypothetical protein GEMRC1_002960 [Eukaryota sp. GEM-RC1]